MSKIAFLFLLLPLYSFAFLSSCISLLDDVYRASRYATQLSKEEFVSVLMKSPYSIKSFVSLSKYEKMKLYMGLSKVPMTKQTYYLHRFSQIENGDKILIDALKNNKNLDDVLLHVKPKYAVTKRRITQVEKEILTSKGARKERVFGRVVVKRKVFKCSNENIALMLKGRAPFGEDGKRVNLHHLKQQKDGILVEMTQTEHTANSAVLHRYVRTGSEISDRNSEFMAFRQKYWKSRAAECMSGRI